VYGLQREELLADIHAIVTVVERAPSLREYRDHGEYVATTITRRFDSWQDAVAQASCESADARTAEQIFETFEKGF